MFNKLKTASAIALTLSMASFSSNAANTSTATFDTGLGIWTNTGEYNWRIYNGATPSYGTGPRASWTYPEGEDPEYDEYDDYDIPRSHGNYIYYEASQSQRKVARLTSPELNNEYKAVTFDYHMHGSRTGTLAVQMQKEGETADSWNTIWILQGEQHANDYLDFTKATVNLENHVAGYENYTIRIIAQSTDYRSDIAIDNIRLTMNSIPEEPIDTPAEFPHGLDDGSQDVYDVEQSEVLFKANNRITGYSSNPSVTFTMAGKSCKVTGQNNECRLYINPIGNFDVTYSIDGRYEEFGFDSGCNLELSEYTCEIELDANSRHTVNFLLEEEIEDYDE